MLLHHPDKKFKFTRKNTLDPYAYKIVHAVPCKTSLTNMGVPMLERQFIMHLIKVIRISGTIINSTITCS